MFQLNYTNFVEDRFKLMETRTLSLLHAAVGLAGEGSELVGAVTKDHIIEELGDCEFYLEAAYQCMLPPHDRPPRAASGALGLIEVFGVPLDIVKKTWIYNAPFDDAAFVRALGIVGNHLQEFYHINKITRSLVIAANVAKLLKRYPVGYDDKAAQARADKAAEFPRHKEIK